jgi:hypothetical protein
MMHGARRCGQQYRVGPPSAAFIIRDAERREADLVRQKSEAAARAQKTQKRIAAVEELERAPSAGLLFRLLREFPSALDADRCKETWCRLASDGTLPAAPLETVEMVGASTAAGRWLACFGAKSAEAGIWNEVSRMPCWVGKDVRFAYEGRTASVDVYVDAGGDASWVWHGRPCMATTLNLAARFDQRSRKGFVILPVGEEPKLKKRRDSSGRTWEVVNAVPATTWGWLQQRYVESMTGLLARTRSGSP